MLIKFIFGSTVLILLSYLVFRVVVKREYLTKGRLTFFSTILELLIFLFHAVFVYLFTPAEWPFLPPFPESPLLNFASHLGIFVGLIIVIISWFNLGSRPSLGLDKNELRTTGLYRFSRNPQLLGYGLFLFVYTILFNSFYALGWFIHYLIISYFMIQSEEEFLHFKYGDAYENYCKNTPRLIWKF